MALTVVIRRSGVTSLSLRILICKMEMLRA